MIGLVVTGDCEQNGLAASLERVFGGCRFEIADKKHSLTSAALGPQPSEGIRSKADEFAAALVAYSRDYEFVVGIDDVEIPNLTDPGRIVGLVVESVRRHVERTFAHQRDRSEAYEILRARVSFHLLAPMIEAYFFGDSTALANARARAAPPLVPSRFPTGDRDVESFVVDDAAFMAVPYPANAPKEARKRSWARLHDRDRDPKAYLKFLSEPDDPLCGARRYRESVEGAAALTSIDWGRVLASGAHGAFARALFDDVADMLDRAPPFLGESHAATSRSSRDRVLRNA